MSSRWPMRGDEVHWSFLQTAFGTVSLTLTEWLVALALSATIFPVLEATKYLLRKRETQC